MSLIIDYHKIVQKFNSDLSTTLRQHGSQNKYLNLWVPDESFLRSLSSLSVSMKAAKVKGFTLKVKKSYLLTSDLKLISKNFIDSKIINEKDYYLIQINNLREQSSKNKLINRVNERKQKIVNYSYGSLKTKNNIKAIDNFFKKKFDERNNSYQKELVLQNKKIEKKILRKKEFSVDKFFFSVFFDEKETFKFLSVENSDNTFTGYVVVFNNLFKNVNLRTIGETGIHEFINFLMKKIKMKAEGIILPFNLGHNIYSINLVCQYFYRNFSKKLNYKLKDYDWFKLNSLQKIKRCNSSINDFLIKDNINNVEIVLDNIGNDKEKNPIRIFVNLNGKYPTNLKPNLIRKLEKFLKTNLDESIQVFYKEKKDLNKIRRL